jgi:hypothetical protein
MNFDVVIEVIKKQFLLECHTVNADRHVVIFHTNLLPSSPTVMKEGRKFCI